jgi:hypothetical protein
MLFFTAMVIPEWGVCFSVYQIVIILVVLHLILPLPAVRFDRLTVLSLPKEERDGASHADGVIPSDPLPSRKGKIKEDGLFYASIAPSLVQRTTAAKAAPTFST